MLGPGPTSLSELLAPGSWVWSVLETVAGYQTRLVQNVAEKSVIVRTLYSGMDTPLLAAREIEARVHAQVQRCRGFHIVHACDNDKSCQVVLTGWARDQKPPKHIFKNFDSRLPESTLRRIQRLEPDWDLVV